MHRRAEERRREYRNRSIARVVGLFTVLVTAVGLGVVAEMLAVDDPKASREAVVGAALMILALNAVVSLRAARAAVVVEGDRVTVRNPLSTRRYSREDIEGFEAGASGRHAYVALMRLGNGRAVALLGLRPAHGWDRGHVGIIDDAVAQLTEWHQEPPRQPACASTDR